MSKVLFYVGVRCHHEVYGYGTLDLDQLNSIAADIAEIKYLLKDLTISIDLDITDTINKFETPSTITTKFPFSLPFDIYNIFNIFSASSEAPKFTIPFDLSSIGGEKYDIVIDLSEFDWIASIVRWFLYAVFIVGLILVTNNLIGRG